MKVDRGSMRLLPKIKPLLVYTMTSGLGDFIVMTDLVKKIESLIPGARCFIVHRSSPHVMLWKQDNHSRRFFNVFSPAHVLKLVVKLKKMKDAGYSIFGVQMAPGSVQGYLFFYFLKKISMLHYIVDFNLINADIITPREGKYILDIHLNQIKELFNIAIPGSFYKLRLPFGMDESSYHGQFKRFIGVHPWSRRGNYSSFIWPYEKWAAVINELLVDEKNEILVFGKDKRFDHFQRFIQDRVKYGGTRIRFEKTNSVEQLAQTINTLDLIVSVNTSVVHIGYALDKKMVILCGPSLDLWVPKGEGIRVVSDAEAVFNGTDKPVNDDMMSSVQRIEVGNVLKNINLLL